MKSRVPSPTRTSSAAHRRRALPCLLAPVLALAPSLPAVALSSSAPVPEQEPLGALIELWAPGFEATAAPTERYGLLELAGEREGEAQRLWLDRLSGRLLGLARQEPEGTWRFAPPPRPLAVAHRGTVELAPENTLAAIDIALEHGADLVELDVRTTADGVPVLMHDATVDRTTDGTGPVAELTLRELRQLDAGSWLSPRFADEPVPTLEEALERLGERAAVDVDFKAGAVEPVLELLRAHGQLARATFHSGDRELLRRLRQDEPRLRIRPTLRGGDELGALIEELDPPIVNLDWRHFDEELVRRIHESGRLAFVNTLGPGDGRERIRRAIAAGADFVQSDLLIPSTALVRASVTTLHAGRPTLDAHNAYPYHGRHADRLERALRLPLPAAIEQDLCWGPGADGVERSLVSHGPPFDGSEPTLADFFAAVRPIVERELRDGDPRQWPVLVLNLDFKGQGDLPEHHAEVLELLRRHEPWLTRAERTGSVDEIAPLLRGPMLVLTGSSDRQQQSFHDRLAPGESLLLFGAVHDEERAEDVELPRPAPADNYRRWWNHPWRAVEPEGQPRAGAWSEPDRDRLATLVDRAHRAGLWIRFFTLNGAGGAMSRERGWSPVYDFGSLEAAELRWREAVAHGVDFLASDQYEELARALARGESAPVD